jgi:hypothetical protein
MATIHPSVPWTDLLPTVLAGLRFLPTRLGLPPAWVVFKQEVRGLPERQGTVPEGVEWHQEASLELQEQLVGEQLRWWQQAEVELKDRISRGDISMAERYAASDEGSKVAFNLQPGDPVLVREFVPGKNKQKARGPMKFVRRIKDSGAEVTTAKGKLKRVAISNLKPYRPPITGKARMVTRAQARR